MKLSFGSLQSRFSASSVLTNSALYTVGNFCAASIPFFLIPFLTTHLEPDEYGVLSMYNIVFSIFNTFTGLSVQGSIVREYFDLEANKFRIFVFNCFLILLLSTVVVLIILFFLAPVLSSVTFIPEKYFPFIALSSAFQFVVFIALALFQVHGKSKQYISLQLITTLFHSIFTVILVVAYDYSWEAKLWAQLLIYGIATMAIVFYLFHKSLLIAKFRLGFIYRAVSFGVPLIPHTLGMYIITFSDRILVGNLLGIEVTGVFTVGVQFGMVIMFLQDAFNKAWVPWFFEKLELRSADLNRRIVKITYYYIAAILLIATGYALLIPYLLPYLVDSQYHNIGKIILLSSLGFAFNGMYKMVTNYIFYARKNSIISLVTFLTALVNVLLTFKFIKWYGAEGAALATMISFLMSFLLTWFCANKIYPMPWSFFLQR